MVYFIVINILQFYQMDHVCPLEGIRASPCKKSSSWIMAARLSRYHWSFPTSTYSGARWRQSIQSMDEKNEGRHRRKQGWASTLSGQRTSSITWYSIEMEVSDNSEITIPVALEDGNRYTLHTSHVGWIRASFFLHQKNHWWFADSSGCTYSRGTRVREIIDEKWILCGDTRSSRNGRAFF